MSHRIISWILLLFIIWIPAQNIKSQNSSRDTNIMRVMSYNIRYQGDPQIDGINAWHLRKDAVISIIKSENPDLIGFQESLLPQIKDIAELLPHFSWIGYGRDGDEKGEYCPVFYNADLYEILYSETFWLSESPDIPSKGWDAALNRICTFAKIKDKVNGRIFYFFNTHLDHEGKESREKSAALILKKIKILASDYPVILTGDFNDTPESFTYEIITSVLHDAAAAAIKNKGPLYSFNGFNTNSLEGKLIDFIFVNDKADVHRSSINSNKINDRYPSDHFPVTAEIEFK